MKILHCSDLHLGRKIAGSNSTFSYLRYNDYFDAFNNIAEYAVENDIDVFVISGDIFDKKVITPEILFKTEEILSKLKNKNIICIGIEGNHDNIIYDRISESWIHYLVEKNLIKRPYYKIEQDNLILEPVKIENVNFYGFGFPGVFVDELLEKINETIVKHENELNYLIIHTAIESSDFIHGTIKNKQNIENLQGKVDYIAAGHFHSFSSFPAENPVFFVPGSPEMWDLNEYKQKKGFIIFDTKTKEIEFVDSQKRKTKIIKIICDQDNKSDAQKYVTEILNDATIDEGKIVYLFIELKHQLELDFTEFEKLLISKGAVNIVKKIIGSNTSELDISQFNGSIYDIEKDIIQTWEYFNKAPDDTLKILNILKTAQIEKNEEDFKYSFDEYLNKLINGTENDYS